MPALTGCMFMAVSAVLASERPDSAMNYSRLLEYIQIEDRQSPLVEFLRGEEGIDQVLNRENVSYLSKEQDLLERIRTQLNSENLEWRLGNASKYLMFVPEERFEYASLFESYCHDVVDYVLSRTRLPNPYQSIATLSGAPESTELSGNEGITAYLVHNIADEYVEEYIFSDRSGEGKKIKIKLRNRVFNGEVGSYTSNLVIGENQQYEFVREPYTLWQNSAENPLNVFIAPIEETLHIALRGSTEDAIKSALEKTQPQKLAEIEQIIEECMAIEEAMVGGLVSRLLPEVFNRYLPGSPAQHIKDAMAHRGAFEKYRYLDRGIQVVSDLGLEAAIELYQTDLNGFKSMLAQPPARPSEVTQPGTPVETGSKKSAA